jgi:hypothetical protein
VNLTPELDRIARLKFRRLHPDHREPGKETMHTLVAHPALRTDHVMMQCGCGYRWRYAERELYAEEKTPVREPQGPAPFVSMAIKKGPRYVK